MLEQATAERVAAAVRCATACHHCAAACLRERDPAAMAACIALDIDCAALCECTAGALARNSAHTTELRALCVTLCEACARECERHGAEHCQACAQACRDCADACRTH